MTAVDSNVVVRFLMRDDEAQWQSADALFRTKRVVILPTVLLEVEWVLRSAYGLHAADIERGLRGVLGLDVVVSPDRGTIDEALRGYAAGLDFADAMHLALCAPSGAEALATFDRAFARRASRLDRNVNVYLIGSTR